MTRVESQRHKKNFFLVQVRPTLFCSVLYKKSGSRSMIDLNLLFSQHLGFFYTNYVVIKICNGYLFDDSHVRVWTKIDWLHLLVLPYVLHFSKLIVTDMLQCCHCCCNPTSMWSAWPNSDICVISINWDWYVIVIFCGWNDITLNVKTCSFIVKLLEALLFAYCLSFRNRVHILQEMTEFLGIIVD
jgi:hypothetical protein